MEISFLITSNENFHQHVGYLLLWSWIKHGLISVQK